MLWQEDTLRKGQGLYLLLNKGSVQMLQRLQLSRGILNEFLFVEENGIVAHIYGGFELRRIVGQQIADNDWDTSHFDAANQGMALRIVTSDDETKLGILILLDPRENIDAKTNA